MKILIKDLALKLGVDRSTALKAIKKMGGIEISKIKVKGVGSLMSSIDVKDVGAVQDHFGVDIKLM